MADKNITLSAREMEVLALAWQCMEAQPKIDMAKLASLTGYTTGSASVTFGNIKRKIRLLGEGLAANGPSTPKKNGGPGRAKATPATSSSSKRTATATLDDAETTTPSKRPKKKSSRTNLDDDDDEEFVKFGSIKKEELNDINTSANDLFGQMNQATFTKAERRKRAARSVRVEGLGEALRFVMGN